MSWESLKPLKPVVVGFVLALVAQLILPTLFATTVVVQVLIFFLLLLLSVICFGTENKTWGVIYMVLALAFILWAFFGAQFTLPGIRLP